MNQPRASSEASSVSLIVTCYNHGRFLAAALDSALAQTTRFTEIILVDDGSTDETEAVAGRYPAVRCLRQSNSGLSAARNAGFKTAAGIFVVFLDADDMLLPSAVSAGLECMARHSDAGFVFGHFECVDAGGAPLPTPAFVPVEADAYRQLLRGNCIGMHATVMYRRDALLASGGFDERLAAAEDYDLYLRIARERPVGSHAGVVARYRKHADNMSNRPRFMLKAVRAVLAKQRSVSRRDPSTRRALAEGRRNWERYYGGQAARIAARELRTPGRRLRGLGRLGTLLLSAPRGYLGPEFNVARGALGRMAPYLPKFCRAWIGRRWRSAGVAAPLGSVCLGDLRSLHPVSRHFGFDRGLPIDRHYIEAFLERNADDIRGCVLEVGGRDYTVRFGGRRVEQSDVLNYLPGDPETSFVADLTTGAGVPDAAFDCIIATQTLHLIFDMPAALGTLHRLLKPGGIALLTVPGTISQIERGAWTSSWRWGLTPLSLRELIERSFAAEIVELGVYGNVLVAVGFLEGLVAEEFTAAELAYRDELYPLLLTARLRKAA